MTKLFKKYISSVKSFFQSSKKAERQYIASLKTEVEDFCVEKNIWTLDEFCNTYGYPSDVVVLTLATCFLVICGVHMYLNYREFADQYYAFIFFLTYTAMVFLLCNK